MLVYYLIAGAAKATTGATAAATGASSSRGANPIVEAFIVVSTKIITDAT